MQTKKPTDMLQHGRPSCVTYIQQTSTAFFFLTFSQQINDLKIDENLIASVN